MHRKTRIGGLLAVSLIAPLLLAAQPAKSAASTRAARPWNADSGAWVGTDSLGRSMPTSQQTGLPRPGRYVGIFYSIWHQDVVTKGIYNNTQILAKHPGALSNPNSPPWPPYGTYDY